MSGTMAQHEKLDTIQILYESENYLILNKPHDVYMNSDDPEEKNTLVCRAARWDSHRKRSAAPLRFAHRLDYATSGAVCAARARPAAAAAGRCFERGAARKYYEAVVRGRVAGDRLEVAYDVGEDAVEDGSHRMRAVTCAGDAATRARAARTRLLVLERGRYQGDPVTVILLKPYTGRRHQLRVHCAAIGHPILGDYTYSNRLDSGPHRMFLHALRLVIPVENEPLDVETDEVFFTDPEFSSRWESAELLRDLRAESRQPIYDFIDSEGFCEDGYKCYAIT